MNLVLILFFLVDEMLHFPALEIDAELELQNEENSDWKNLIIKSSSGTVIFWIRKKIYIFYAQLIKSPYAQNPNV